MIAVGGFTYMASAGNTSAIKKGKGMITDALIGLIIALFAWFILNVINPDLVNLKIEPLEALQFEANVSLSHGEPSNATSASATPGVNTQPCRGGVIDIPEALGKRLTSSSTNRICKDLADKLVQMKNSSGLNIYVTSSIRGGGTQSQCHLSGNVFSGNCADISLETSLPRNDPRWDDVCKAIASTSGLSLFNEASSSTECTRLAPYATTDNTSAPHAHVKFVGN
jgi:hypothetical protein